MKHIQKFVGLDVSKEMISVGVADAGREEPHFHGNIPNKPEAIRKLMKKLGNPETYMYVTKQDPQGTVF
jgi:hypothetical protein